MGLTPTIDHVERMLASVEILDDDEFVIEHGHMEVGMKVRRGWHVSGDTQCLLHAESRVRSLIAGGDRANEDVGAGLQVERGLCVTAGSDSVRASHLLGPLWDSPAGFLKDRH